MSVQDIELVRKQMEEEIQSQIQDNQKLLLDSSISWDDKVRDEKKNRISRITSKTDLA